MKFIFLGFIIAYNPIYIFYLMFHGAIGGMTMRIISGSSYLLLLIYVLCIIGFVKKRPISMAAKAPLSCLMNWLFIFFLLGIFMGILKGNDSKYLLKDTYVFFEMFVIFYSVRLLLIFCGRWESKKIIKWFSIYLVIMGASDIIIYSVLSFIMETNFGALRAYISGVTVNRLMDFIVPMALPATIIFTASYSKNKKVPLAIGVLAFIVTMLTFYRTIYLAVFAGCFCIFLIRKWNINNVRVLLKGLIVITIISTIILVAAQSYFASECNFLCLVKERISSIYKPEAGYSHSISSRITQLKYIINTLDYFPFGYGMGGYLNETTPISVTSNYFVQTMLLLGLPGGTLFLWIYIKTFLISFRMARVIRDRWDKLFLIACASILTYLAIILLLFPYTVYFPLLFLFGWIAGAVETLYMKYKVLIIHGTRISTKQQFCNSFSPVAY